jgi:membrane dipeptidase
MLIWDAHLDIASRAIHLHRNYLDPVHVIRQREKEMKEFRPTVWGLGEGTLAFPEMRQGEVAVCFATLLGNVSSGAEPNLQTSDFQTIYQAYGSVHGQLAYYRALQDDGIIRIITGKDQLEGHLAAWQAWDADSADSDLQPPPLGFILSTEGSDMFRSPAELEDWYKLGLRVLMPGHFGPGKYMGGTGTDLPINEDGIALLNEAQRLGMILDLNHLSDESFWQAYDHFTGPVFASHSNCRALVSGQRQLSDDQILALIKRNGIIGVCVDIWMLESDWVPGISTNENVSLETLADHIEHICQLAGNSQHAGIGTDLDGGYGYKQCPNDFDTIADLQKLHGILDKRGYSSDDVMNIFYRNFSQLALCSW